MGEDGELGGRTLGRLQEPEVRRARFPSIRSDKPDVRWRRSLRFQVTVVANFECIEMLFYVFLVLLARRRLRKRFLR